MISYLDRTFCASQVDTHTCGRVLTKEQEAHAKELGLPIAYMNICKPETDV